MNDALLSHKSDEWETPHDLFDKLDKELHFDIDVCATPENAKCKRFFTKEQDGLKMPWVGVCWCNPPYSNIAAWVQKARNEAKNGAYVVMLIPARTDTKWFHEHIYENGCCQYVFLKGRLMFLDSAQKEKMKRGETIDKTKRAPFPSMLVYMWG